MKTRLIGSFGFLFCVMLLSWGCEDRPPIQSYTVNKPAPMRPMPNPHDAGLPKTLPSQTPATPPTGEPTDRTLGAILPTTPQGWFFKLTGPEAEVGKLAEAFTEFLKTVTFADDGKPSWTLPEGWQQQAGNQFRFATVVIPGTSKPLELTISALPNAGDNNQHYVLMNLNRWRGQLQLPPITAEQLATETTSVDMAGTPASVVNIAGHATADSMSPPFFRGATNGN